MFFDETPVAGGTPTEDTGTTTENTGDQGEEMESGESAGGSM